VQPLPGLQDYTDFALALIFWVGLTFELPLVMFFLARIDLVSARQFARQWRFAVVIIVVIAAVITPTVDIFNMTLVVLPMLGLYLLGIAFAWLARPRASSQALVQSTTRPT
jgi:sec-independent protein translocase protein TatC